MRVGLTIACAVVVSGCSVRPGGGSNIADPAEGGVGDSGTPSRDTESGVPVVDLCDERARWIYLVDIDRALLRYEPDTGTITRVGTLNCPASGGATPLSMAVDRNATAWVLYSNGDLFRVATLDANCEATGFARGQAGFDVFGMGFATDEAGGSAETLYVAGGDLTSVGARDSQFGVLDLTSLILQPRGGTIDGSPELTGNGRAELWAFSPNNFGTATVNQLDKSTGASLQTFPLASVQTFGSTAWAFAFWGGGYYVFVQTFVDSSTRIFRFDATTGGTTEVMSDIGYSVVGAGVSTCAPVEIQ